MNTIVQKLYQAYTKSTGVSTDTRNIQKGEMFFALKGGSFNGNKYGAQAIESGAYIVVLDERNNEVKGDQVIYVTDALKALQELAKYHRNLIKAKVIGLTGSNGKTTTKELLYQILKSHNSNTYCTHGNLNNHIGVPLTLLSIPSSAEYAIVEMGSNQPGDIKELSDIAEPDYGLITNIGKTHLERLKTQDGVYQEKTSLYRKIKERKGTFFLNEGDEYLRQIKDDQVITYSSERTLESQLKVLEDQLSLNFEISHKKAVTHVSTNLFGNFNIENVAAAIAIAEHFKVPLDQISKAIESYRPNNMRSQIVKTDLNTVVLDAYNSNPFSLKESLTHFRKLDIPNKIVVIGDMLELGETSQVEHESILKIAQEEKGMSFYFVGREFLKAKIDSNAEIFAHVDEAIEHFSNKPVSKSNILLKGSRGIRLEKLMDIL